MYFIYKEKIIYIKKYLCDFLHKKHIFKNIDIYLLINISQKLK